MGGKKRKNLLVFKTMLISNTNVLHNMTRFALTEIKFLSSSTFQLKLSSHYKVCQVLPEI